MLEGQPFSHPPSLMPHAHAVRRVRRGLFSGLLGLALALPATAQSLQGAAFTPADVDRVEWSADTGIPTFLAGTLGSVPGKTGAAAADAFLAANADLFRLSDKTTLADAEVERDRLGMQHVRVHQHVGGVPVFGGDAKVHLDRSGAVVAFGGTFHPGAEAVDTTPAVDAQSALSSARRVLPGLVERQPEAGDELAAAGRDWAPTSELVVLPHEGTYLLAYHVRLYADAPHPANWNVFVDAATGQVVHRFNELHTFDPRADAAAGPRVAVAQTMGAMLPLADGPTTGSGTRLYEGTASIPTYLYQGNYYLYDTTRGPQYIRTMTGNNGTSLPGSYVTDSNNNFSATSQRAAVSAHYGAVRTFDYFKDTHGRNSYNGSNASITSTVNHRSNYNNAFWNGSQMVYGDGDGQTFGPLVELDIVAHELTHAVTGSSAGLIYQNESGAINEAVSDIFAVMVDRNDYKVGEQSYTPGTPGDALRDIQNPPAGNQPDHYDDRYTGSQDNGGVHINSGIANKQAYLMIAGGTFRGVSVQSVGRSVTERVWYRALTQYFTSSTNFAGARQGTLSAAADLYGNGSAQYNAVANAWAAVGVGSAAGGGTPPPPSNPQWYYENRTYQSAHNYANNTNTTDTYSKPGASRVAMYFERFDLESNYDYVYIKDQSNATKASYTGRRSAFWAVVDGSQIKANFVSDYSVTRWGWRVTRVAYYAGGPLAVADEDPGTPMDYVPEAPASDAPALTTKGALTTALQPVRPNPTAGDATVAFSLAEAGVARVTLHDVLGREVAVLHEGETEAGAHGATVDASALPAGTYLVVMEADGDRQTRRLTVTR